MYIELKLFKMRPSYINTPFSALFLMFVYDPWKSATTRLFQHLVEATWTALMVPKRCLFRHLLVERNKRVAGKPNMMVGLLRVLELTSSGHGFVLARISKICSV